MKKATIMGYAFEVDGIYYGINDDGKTVYVTSGDIEYSGEVAIPSTVTYDSTTYLVTSIGEKAFSGCSGLMSVTIPESVTSIGDFAFEGCSGLTKVEISDIAAWCNIVFGNYSANPLVYAHNLYLNGVPVTNLEIPESVTKIGDWAFAGCSGLTSVTIPKSVTKIGDWAFAGCSGLTSVTILKSVTSIGIGAFEGCSGLTSVTIPESVTVIRYAAFAGCSGLTSVTIPESVTKIGDWAFKDCRGLTKVEISDIAAWCNIVFGNDSANPLYYAHNLYLNGELVTNLELPESVTKIRNWAFAGCSGLTSVTIPESVTKIGNWAFAGCSGLTSVTIPESVTSIGYRAFEGCSGLTSVTIPESVTEIGWCAFEDCSGLTSVTIPESVTEIGWGAFEDCSGLTKVEISDIAAWCNIVFGNDEANPLYYAHNLYLSGELVTNLVIPESVTSIGEEAFAGCSGLTSVNIPKSVTEIGDCAFDDCIRLAKVEISDIAAWCNIVFGPNFANPLYYAHNLYLNGELVTNLELPESVTKIGDYAFEDCSGLTSVNIPKSVTEIGDSAFEGCSGLTSVTIPNSVFSIGYAAFIECDGLTSVTIPESVTEIGDFAFGYCTKLMSFTSLNVTPPTLPGETTFEGMSRSCQLYVPESSVMAYQTSTGWTFFSHVNEIPDSGVDAIETETLTVTTDGGAIRVDGAEGAVIEVYSLGGMLLYRGTETTIAMQSGAYLVKVAGKTQKVVL